MDSDTKSLLIGIVGSIIGGLVIYLLIKPAIRLQQSNQLQLQEQQQIRQQEYQQYQQTQPLPLSSNY